MVALPTSIEAALKDAGFCGTEIVVLRRLLEDEALTLRELAAKTGKSTGVLDQALKKLLRKGIINRQEFNSTTKYSLLSINAISAWMNRDMHEKRSELSRRLQNFEAFISTVEMHRNRPEMEYFDGEDGIKAAYEKLITFPAKEILIYDPILWTAEEDPLRDFRVQLFRKRRARGLFCRVIGPNTPLGRRFQSRDPFEFRKTTLVEPESNLVNMEKLIISEVVACISHEEKRACFIRFRDMADSERKLFNGIWDREVQREKASAGAQYAPASSAIAPSTSTHVLSAVREFFLSKKSLVTFLTLGVLSAVLTGGLYMRTSAFNLQRMKDKVQAIATTASFQFDARDLDQLRVESDWKKPEWAKVVNQLRDIRQSNKDILFAYIVRKRADDPTKGEFVADSHSLNPYANTDDDPTNDVNVGEDDGIFDPEGAEKLQWPGQPYDTMPPEAFDAFTVPTTNKDFYQDLFGKVITGYAPIKDSAGNPVAVVAIDMEYAQLGRFNAQSFRPIFYFLGIFLAFVLIRFFAFNRSLVQELWKLAGSIRVRWYVPVIIAVVVALIFGIRYYLWRSAVHSVGLRMQSIAATAAPSFSHLDLDSLRKAEDMKTETYQQAFKLLNDVRNKNPGVKYAYIFRQTSNSEMLEFVADADSSYFLPELMDFTFDGKLDDADENVYPGFVTVDSNQSIVSALMKNGLSGYDIAIDQWGKWISGFAAIHDKNGEVMGVLGVDFESSKI